jgi:hypothetical protein
MSLVPDIDRILLGPGPRLTPPRVMCAMAAPTLSRFDPLMLLPGAPESAFARQDRSFRA